MLLTFNLLQQFCEKIDDSIRGYSEATQLLQEFHYIYGELKVKIANTAPIFVPSLETHKLPDTSMIVQLQMVYDEDRRPSQPPSKLRTVLEVREMINR